jgi:tRNA A-37 threonylcarbamoyl transferase component Bud32/tetratricopeptide (TPR) repeat protein
VKGRFGRLQEVFEAAIDLNETERCSLIDRLCADDAGLRREVLSMLVHLDEAESFIASRMSVAKSCVKDTRPRPGDRIGPYRIDREIGSGGMATVYMATRDDGQFEQRVAVKLLRSGLDSRWALGRFCYERQILATLTHPNISQLLDGGSTPDGLPYLVMEYIEGKPIVEHCRERQLSTRQRLLLFQRVCGAVAHAHRNLIVHRDIKPGNILVTSEGIPKLLDFGISKLLDPFEVPRDGRSPTLHLMTPEYASPEQVRGESVTTATDIYSLGVVLYELLTDRAPYTVEGVAPGQIERAVCGKDPPKPSVLAGRLLAGDLDNIVMKAIEKDPARRYLSVDQLAEDILRYLKHRPVLARTDTFLYRAAKFFRRHRAAAVASVLLSLTLLGGITATAWQAKKVAEQILRAERRFLQFRKLANAFLLDFHGKIQRMNDITEARELVLRTGIEYMDELARETDGDPILIRELARAYEKFGDIQGFSDEAAMGRSADAIISYRKAVDMLEPLYESGLADPESRILLSRSYCKMGKDVERVSGNLDESRRLAIRCLEVIRALGESRPDVPRFFGLMHRAYLMIGDLDFVSQDYGAALARYSTILKIQEKDARSIGTNHPMWLAETKRRIGRLQAVSGDDDAALESFKEALRLTTSMEGAPYALHPGRETVAAYLDLVRHIHKLASAGNPAMDPKPLVKTALEFTRRFREAHPLHPLTAQDLQAATDLHDKVMR